MTISHTPRTTMDKRTYLKNALKKDEPGIGMWLT